MINNYKNFEQPFWEEIPSIHHFYIWKGVWFLDDNLGSYLLPYLNYNNVQQKSVYTYMYITQKVYKKILFNPWYVSNYP